MLDHYFAVQLRVYVYRVYNTSNDSLTSFSKKPERSKHEDIPISWKALIRVGDRGLFSPSDVCTERKK